MIFMLDYYDPVSLIKAKLLNWKLSFISLVSYLFIMRYTEVLVAFSLSSLSFWYPLAVNNKRNYGTNQYDQRQLHIQLVLEKKASLCGKKADMKHRHVLQLSHTPLLCLWYGKIAQTRCMMNSATVIYFRFDLWYLWFYRCH